mmetsp:Transcript_62937/g.99864  ORF Transcript_62937/g.99864 Transcript_62937/m.99864 type:complete len:229 (-) Transcript_62937:310-996(-)
MAALHEHPGLHHGAERRLRGSPEAPGPRRRHGCHQCLRHHRLRHWSPSGVSPSAQGDLHRSHLYEHRHGALSVPLVPRNPAAREALLGTAEAQQLCALGFHPNPLENYNPSKLVHCDGHRCVCGQQHKSHDGDLLPAENELVFARFLFLRVLLGHLHDSVDDLFLLHHRLVRRGGGCHGLRPRGQHCLHPGGGQFSAARAGLHQLLPLRGSHDLRPARRGGAQEPPRR